MSLTPTDEQSAIIHWQGQKLVVNAFAGTGTPEIVQFSGQFRTNAQLTPLFQKPLDVGGNISRKSPFLLVCHPQHPASSAPPEPGSPGPASAVLTGLMTALTAESPQLLSPMNTPASTTPGTTNLTSVLDLICTAHLPTGQPQFGRGEAPKYGWLHIQTIR
ncbi:UNVERIFIED_ORG: hypothetical protein FHU00_5036 [Citrobacter freundii]